MRNQFLKTILIVAAASAFSSSAMASSHTKFVHNPSGSITAKISTADLNLGSLDGQRALKKRVASAVRHICRVPGSLWNHEMTCRHKAYRDARPQQFAAINRAQTQLAMVTRRN